MKKSALITAILLATAPMVAGQAQQNINDRQNVAGEDDGGSTNEQFVDQTGGRVQIDDEGDGSSEDKPSSFRDLTRPPLPSDDDEGNTFNEENDRDDLEAGSSETASAYDEVQGRVAPGNDPPATAGNTYEEEQDRQSTSSGDDGGSGSSNSYGELQGRQVIGSGDDGGDDGSSNTYGEEQGRQLMGGGSNDDGGDLADLFGELQDRQQVGGNSGGNDDGGGTTVGEQHHAPSGAESTLPDTFIRLTRGLSIGGEEDELEVPNFFGEQQGRTQVGGGSDDDDNGGTTVGEQHHSAPGGGGQSFPSSIQRLTRGILIGGNDEDDVQAPTTFGEQQGRTQVGGGSSDDDNGGTTVGEQHHSASSMSGEQTEISGRTEMGPGGLIYKPEPPQVEADRDDAILIGGEPSGEEESDDLQNELQDYIEFELSGDSGSSYALFVQMERDAAVVLVAAGELFNDAPSGSIHVYLPRTDSSELPTVILFPLD